MTDGDSGVDTGSESNESNSMSIGSPSRSDEDKELLSLFQKTPNAGREWFHAEEFGLNYLKGVFPGKVKRSKRSSRKHDAIPKLKDIIGERKLRTAAITNAFDTAKNLLDLGVSPRAYDSKGRTALHFASAGGHTNIAQLLLERGADPNQRDSVGNTPLHLAVCTTNIEMVTLLLKAGTNINALDYAGRSAFHLAQSKLCILSMNKEYSSAQLRTEVLKVLEMMNVYLRKAGRECEEFINAFSRRLQRHQTRAEVDTDVKDLLSNLSDLSLQKT